jgi:U4/U6 small nuclear ribonucleoprotein PRP3
MGKQRRQAELQDKRDRILTRRKVRSYPIYWEGNTNWVASPVRLANLMKVLTSDAVQDPTRVEAHVWREVAICKHRHGEMNAERKLTVSRKTQEG